MNIMPGEEGKKIIKNVIEEASLSVDEKDYLKTKKWYDYDADRSDLKYK